MKFDKVYDFVASGPRGTKLTKTELALYYLALFQHPEYRELRYPKDLSTSGEEEIPIIDPKTDYIDFNLQDILDYLYSVGNSLNR